MSESPDELREQLRAVQARWESAEAERERARQARELLLRRCLAADSGVARKDVAEIIGVSRSRVSQLAAQS